MPIRNPSQFDCDKMEKGDMIFVKARSRLYKWYRNHFKKDLIQIKVKENWEEPYTYVTYYQEDCTLMFAWELECIQTIDEIPCILSLNSYNPGIHTFLLKRIQIGLYNIQIIFKNNLTLTIPTEFFIQGINKNENILKNIKDKRVISEQIKFLKHKPEKFKEIVQKYEIKEWIPAYCSICGTPIILKFNEDDIIIDNQCNCGAMKLSMDKMSYDEFAIWYASQINPITIKKFEKFWFER